MLQVGDRFEVNPGPNDFRECVVLAIVDGTMVVYRETISKTLVTWRVKSQGSLGVLINYAIESRNSD